MSKKNDWTVFFLVEAVEGFTAEVKFMLTDILNVQRHEGIDVSVILCISGMVNSLYAAGLTYEKSIGETSESMTTAFYELLFSGTNKTSFAFIGKKINFDIDSEKSIQKFFHTQIFLRHRAEKYLLLTWDHGSVFGIFKDAETLGNAEQASVENVDKTGTPASINVVSNSELHTVVTFGKDGTIITQMNKKSLKPRNQKVSFRQICHQQKVKAPDQIGFKILTMTNLGKAIRKAMLKKIDVLVMMNCCMQYFDSGYQLSGATDYLVAPETIMDFYGYNYKKMLDYLFASGKSVDGLNMAEKTIEFYCQKKYATPALTDSILGSSAIFANDLKHYNNTGDLINKLSKKLLAIPSSDFSSIIDARNKCANIAGVGAYNLLDFFTFIEFLKKDPNFETDEDISNLLQLRTEIVKSEHIGKDTLANSLGTVVKPSGFSIYFPLSENYNSYSSFFKIYVSPTSKFVTPFSKTSSWPKFIIKYVDIAPNLPIF